MRTLPRVQARAPGRTDETPLSAACERYSQYMVRILDEVKSEDDFSRDSRDTVPTAAAAAAPRSTTLRPRGSDAPGSDGPGPRLACAAPGCAHAGMEQQRRGSEGEAGGHERHHGIALLRVGRDERDRREQGGPGPQHGHGAPWPVPEAHRAGGGGVPRRPRAKCLPGTAAGQNENTRRGSARPG